MICIDSKLCRSSGRVFFYSLTAPLKDFAQSWWVSGGLSALPHEPAQTTDAPEKPNRSKPQKRNERKLSNEKDEKSMCSVTRSVVRFPACLSVRRRGPQQQQRAWHG